MMKRLTSKNGKDQKIVKEDNNQQESIEQFISTLVQKNTDLINKSKKLEDENFQLRENLASIEELLKHKSHVESERSRLLDENKNLINENTELGVSLLQSKDLVAQITECQAQNSNLQDKISKLTQLVSIYRERQHDSMKLFLGWQMNEINMLSKWKSQNVEDESNEFDKIVTNSINEFTNLTKLLKHFVNPYQLNIHDSDESSDICAEISLDSNGDSDD